MNVVNICQSMNLELIKTEAEKAHIPFKSVASAIGMSEGNLHRCVRENKIQAQDLEKIASVLHVNVGIFFDELPHIHVEVKGRKGQAAGNNIYNNADQAEIQRLKDRIAHLEERIIDKDAAIADRDARIADKDELISILKKQ